MQSLYIFKNSASAAAKPSLMAMVKTWAFRLRSRRQLATLPQYILDDIGLSDFQAKREAERPFWQ